jgi:uncharacterized membrane protein
MKTPSRKVTVVYTERVGYSAIACCVMRITVKAGESIERAFERRSGDMGSVWHVLDGWPKQINTDWSKPL